MARRKTKNSGLLQGGLAVVGAVLMASDSGGILKFDRFHHWQLGAGILLLSLFM